MAKYPPNPNNYQYDPYWDQAQQVQLKREGSLGNNMGQQAKMVGGLANNVAGLQHRTVLTSDLAERIERMEHRTLWAMNVAESISNELSYVRRFYEWMIHAYPETIAQYKALKDLEAAANGGVHGGVQTEDETMRASSAI